MTATPTSSAPGNGGKVRVAIVGSGLTGLVSAHLLSPPGVTPELESRINVDIFERAPTLGMDSASISVPLPIALDATANSDEEEPALRSRSRKRLKLQPQPSTQAQLESQCGAKKGDKLLRIDVPMRAFTGGYYPNLLALYQRLGIRIKKTNFTYSFANLPALSKHSPKPALTPTPTILYNGANGFRGVSIPSNLISTTSSTSSLDIALVLAQIARLRAYFSSLLSLVLGYLQLLVIAVYHNWTGHTSNPDHPLRGLTLQQLVHNPFPASAPQLGWRKRAVEAVLRRCVRLEQRFAEETLAPLMSAVMTCSLDSVWSCPAGEVLDYVALTLGKDHFVVRDGVRTVVAALVGHLDAQGEAKISNKDASGSVWTDAEVRSVTYRDGKAWVNVVHHNDDIKAGKEEKEHGPFDHIIFATQANQTAHFLQAYQESIRDHDEAEALRVEQVRQALASFKYERATVVNHTNRTLLPAAKADWRDLNLITTAGEFTMATHILRLESEHEQAKGMLIMQSTNPLPSLQPLASTVLSQTTFERAVIDVPANQARQLLFTKPSQGNLALGTLQTSQHADVGIWVGGSWASGIPLLEGCVVSAQLIAQTILTRTEPQPMQA